MESFVKSQISFNWLSERLLTKTRGLEKRDYKYCTSIDDW